MSQFLLIGGYFTDQIHDLSNRFPAGHEYFVLSRSLVTACINLIVIDIYHLPAGENIPQHFTARQLPCR